MRIASRAGRVLDAAILLLALIGCNDDAGNVPDSAENTLLTFDAACHTDTLHLPCSGSWKITSEAEWITIGVSNGTGDVILPVYIQENDDDAEREGRLLLFLNGKEPREIKVVQSADAHNGSPLVNLPQTYGLGWGYDLREDYADISGVRGQVFDSAALINDWGEDAIITEVQTVTNMNFVKSQSSETLQQEISGKVTGTVDLKVASAKVSVEYKDQITEQKERLYVWCRDFRGVKTAYFDNDVDIMDYDVVRWCTTSSFRTSVRNDSPEEIVRKFGTHLITRSCLGGKLDYYFTVSTDITTEVEQIITAINVKILFIKKSQTWVDEKVWTDIKKDFVGNFVVSGGGETGRRLNSELKAYASKGEPLIDDTLFDKWYARFSNAGKVNPDDLAMVDFNVLPIWYVITPLNSEKGKAVEEYITKKYLK